MISGRLLHIGRSGQGRCEGVNGEVKVASALHDWFGDMFAPSALQGQNAHRQPIDTKKQTFVCFFISAEVKGFEPLYPVKDHAFQACAIDHYATPPE